MMHDWIDPYVYTGYFFNLPQYLNVFSSAYYGGRLPWLLLGYAMHQLLPPAEASYALRLVLCYGAALSLFAILWFLYGDAFSATISALLLTTYSYFLWAIGWDYVDGPGLVFALVAMACLVSAARTSAWRLGLVCAGMAQAAMVTTYIALGLLIPIQLAWYLVIAWGKPQTPYLRQLLFLFVGWAALIVTLGAANYFLCGRFLFFLSQLDVALSLGKNPHVWQRPLATWIPQATWLVYPGIVISAGTIVVLRLVAARIAAPGTAMFPTDPVSAILLLLTVTALFAGMQARGFWFLQYSFYASYLVPFVFVALGAVLAYASLGLPSPRRWLLLVGLAVLLLAPWHPDIARLLPVCGAGCNPAYIVGASAAAATLFAVAALWRNALCIVSAVVMCAVLNISIADARVFTFPPSSTARSATMAMVDAIRAIQPRNRDGQLRFWYSASDPLGPLFQGVASAYLWEYRIVSADFPKRTDPLTHRDNELGPGERVVILSTRPNVAPVANRNLEHIELHADQAEQIRIQHGSIGFYMTFVQLQPAAKLTFVDLPLSRIALTNIRTSDTHAKSLVGGVAIRTPPAPWSYAAILPLPPDWLREKPSLSAIVRLRLSVRRGHIGVGVLNRDKTDFVVRRDFLPGPPQDVYLRVPTLGDASDIVIENWGTLGIGFVKVTSASAALVNPSK